MPLDFNMTSYYAKRVIGDDQAIYPLQALLQSGPPPTGGTAWNTWLFIENSLTTDTTKPYGIFHHRANDAKKLEFFGGGATTPSAWIKMDTGDAYFAGKMGIGYDPNTSGNGYKLYVNGTTYINGAITVAGNVTPATTNASSLGTGGNTAKRWSKLYVGTADTYGDAYTPVYWYNGLPTTTAPVQYCTWTLPADSKKVTLKHAAFTTNSFVLALVVTSGEANLNAPIKWTTTTNSTNVNLSTLDIETATATSGAVSGYVVVARGESITTT